MYLELVIPVLVNVLLTVSALDLVIIHTNDIHARFDESDKRAGDCSEDEHQAGKCFGGVARIVTKINELKEQHDNVLVLDAGDQFQGTLWFYHYRGAAAAHFMQTIGYDAMALGNHEFDNGIDDLVPFLESDTPVFPVLSSNIDAVDEPSVQGFIQNSTIITLTNGEQIGIVGYTTKDTPNLSKPGNLIFNPEVESIRAEVERLKTQGVNKIIVLGHGGVNKDMDIAGMVDGVDVVIGGHTNTFLYTGEPPSNEDPYDTYPIAIHPGDDVTRNVLVVQDYAYGKYLGYLQVTFDTDGEVIEWSGNPILLDKTVEQDPETLADVLEWKEPIYEMQNDIIGSTRVYLDGERQHCRTQECNLGNLIADAMVHQNMKHPDETKWADVTIALMNSGAIRSSINVDETGFHSITVGDVLNVLPYRDTFDLLEIKGKSLREALEHSVSEIIPEDPHPRYFQMSGLIVTYDIERPVGERVVKVEAKCTACRVPEFHPLEDEAVYKLVLPTFIANGGDGYDMFVDDRISYHIPGDLDTDVLMEYITTMSPITLGLENRINYVVGGNPCNISSTASSMQQSSSAEKGLRTTSKRAITSVASPRRDSRATLLHNKFASLRISRGV
ncbi:snake venom 5'-nucleotidase-like [Saccoglossus kowalevskii]|uniref:5'-nucleotidase n=1 Tax=Saccoglossus kowalevskii TaxID=10224 RepID=A0ABM0H173_SACKO|nr:PREDICTED: 5'-nucleotidase-like [Saccoglossus kowalevskii]